jgi:hypothetical protein
MILTFEFFIGLIGTFLVGYLLSVVLEKFLHQKLDDSNQHG